MMFAVERTTLTCLGENIAKYAFFRVVEEGPMYILISSVETVESTESNLNDHAQNQFVISTMANRSVDALPLQSIGWRHSSP